MVLFIPRFIPITYLHTTVFAYIPSPLWFACNTNGHTLVCRRRVYRQGHRHGLVDTLVCTYVPFCMGLPTYQGFSQTRMRRLWGSGCRLLRWPSPEPPRPLPTRPPVWGTADPDDFARVTGAHKRGRSDQSRTGSRAVGRKEGRRKKKASRAKAGQTTVLQERTRGLTTALTRKAR